MSGSRALASARRRRANPDEKRQQQQQQPPPPPLPASTNTNSNTKPLSKNPMELLLSHHKMISDLQESVKTMEHNLDTQSRNMNDTMRSLTMDESSIEFFKQKIAFMENQMNDMKKHIIKIQTFTMDTSILCNEIRRKMDMSSIAENKQLDEASLISNTLTEEVQEETTLNDNSEIKDM